MDKEAIKRNEGKTKKLMTKPKALYPKDDIDRMC